MLLFHAAAILGGTALAQQGLLWRPLALGVLVGWVVGAALFSGDIATRAVAGHRLFAMAAPTGGVILITAWLALIAAAFGCSAAPRLRLPTAENRRRNCHADTPAA